jgi:hypothetical protein
MSQSINAALVDQEIAVPGFEIPTSRAENAQEMGHPVLLRAES